MVHTSRRVRSPLFPQTARACSPQTGTLVYRNYDFGENPYKSLRRNQDDSEVRGVAEEPAGRKPMLPDLPRYRQGTKLARRALFGVQRSADLLMMQLPSIQREEQRTAARRDVVERAKRRHHKPMVAPSLSKVEQLIERVRKLGLGLESHGGIGPGIESEDSRRRAKRSVSLTETPPPLLRSTDSPVPEDRTEALTLQEYKAYRAEFDKCLLDGRLFGAVSANAEITLSGLLLTPAMIKRSINVSLEVDFDQLLHQALSHLSWEHIGKLKSLFLNSERSRQTHVLNFREKQRLSTVRDLERCFASMLHRFAKTERLAKDSHEPGLTEDEYVQYVLSTGAASSDTDARVVFQRFAVPSLTRDAEPVITVEEFADMVKQSRHQGD